MTVPSNITRERQERRIRWQHGVSEAQARVIASLYFGEARR